MPAVGFSVQTVLSFAFVAGESSTCGTIIACTMLLTRITYRWGCLQAQLAAENAKMWRSLVSADQANGLH